MKSLKWHKNTPVVALLIISLLLTVIIFTTIKLNNGLIPPPKKTTMTIFVHGSFGSLLGFLSLGDVLSDRISGTTYRNVTKKMRMDDFFFKDQPILDRGLKYIKPTLYPADVQNRKYAIYPVAKAYELIAQAVSPHQESDLFYTFGWTGTISQHSRRFEAVRFYNALTEELARLQRQNVIPKIRMIAHSHGGNLCLNLAAIQTILETNIFDKNHLFSKDPDEQESIVKMLEIFQTLNTQEIAKMRPDQKAYDYLPTTSALHIDELIMLGTPIQPETESFCYSPLFDTVYNLYSDEDIVQKIDWVSSKKGLSSARITKANQRTGKAAHLKQAKIITHIEQTNNPQTTPASEQSMLQDLLAGKNIFARGSADPTHKELWFFTWQDDPHGFNLPIAPLPIVTLIPMITQALQETKSNDVTITLKQTDTSFSVIASNQKEQLATTTIPRKIITTLQQQAQAWAPADKTGMSEFEAVYKHLIK
jgi:hypothetical protein